jgi:3-deoxy-manno-octulosonate cytidylyltransferase (CMP-KDO synthetase)
MAIAPIKIKKRRKDFSFFSLMIIGPLPCLRFSFFYNGFKDLGFIYFYFIFEKEEVNLIVFSGILKAKKVFFMLHGKKIICVIPARLASSRFPKKLLALLLGKPVLQWSWESAKRISFFDEVVIALDAEEMIPIVEGFQGKWVKTSLDCPSGTDRLIQVYKKGLFQGDIWVNWQGDEPFLQEKSLQDLLQSCAKEGVDLWTLKTKIEDQKEALDPSVCKVVCNAQGQALYFSRAQIPYPRADGKRVECFKHIGLYAYTTKALDKISTLSVCALEECEKLEQLRFLYEGLQIQVEETKERSIGIDLVEHLALAEAYVKKGEVFN